MALITCPECGRKKVSDTAEACPSCGFGIKAYLKRSMKKRKIKRKKLNIQNRNIESRNMKNRKMRMGMRKSEKKIRERNHIYYMHYWLC